MGRRPPTQPSQRISDNQAVGWQPAACPPDAPHRPAARGHGVGDHLVQAVSHWAQQAGAEVLRLAVVPGNENAAALYRRNGFRPTGELGDLMPDGVRREHIMAKDLSTGA